MTIEERAKQAYPNYDTYDCWGKYDGDGNEYERCAYIQGANDALNMVCKYFEIYNSKCELTEMVNIRDLRNAIENNNETLL